MKEFQVRKLIVTVHNHLNERMFENIKNNPEKYADDTVDFHNFNIVLYLGYFFKMVKMILSIAIVATIGGMIWYALIIFEKN